jgi:hypothetical protein
MITRLRRLGPVLVLAAVATLWAVDADIRSLSTNLLPAMVVDAEGWSR